MRLATTGTKSDYHHPDLLFGNGLGLVSRWIFFIRLMAEPRATLRRSGPGFAIYP